MLYCSTISFIRSLPCEFPHAARRILTVLAIAFTLSAQAQNLEISSISFGPDSLAQADTLDINGEIVVNLSVFNPDSTGQLGNLKIWFRNESNNLVELPLGGFDALQFFAPLQHRDLQIALPVTPDFFIEGGNTVVIWPSFVGEDGNAGTDPVVRNFFVRVINSIPPYKEGTGYSLPNPVFDLLYIQVHKNSATPIEAIIRDISGKIVLRAPYSDELPLNVEAIAPGIYLLELRLPESKSYVQRIVKSGR